MDFINNIDFTNLNIIIGIFISFLGGIVSSFSPCTLSTLPLIIGYVAKDENNEVNSKNKNKRKSGIYSLFFALGLTVTFVIIGIISTVLSVNLKIFGNWWYLFLAIILTLTSLYMLDVFKFNKSKNNTCKRPKLKKTALGAFFLGILGGFFDSPCSTPVLVVIITFISQTSNILYGALLMFFYSIGHCILIVIAGTSLETINKLVISTKYNKIGIVLKKVFAIMTLCISFYLYYIAF